MFTYRKMSHLHENCTFCKIIDKQDPKTEILFENDRFLIFSDIRPASDFHFLAVPREHIVNPKHLTEENRELVEEMRNALATLLKTNGIDDEQKTQSLFGFHWPPFNSVQHLHMHAIAPISNMSFLGKMIFKPNNYWFKTVDYVLSHLQPKKTEN